MWLMFDSLTVDCVENFQLSVLCRAVLSLAPQ